MSKANTVAIQLPLPDPLYAGPYQNGITDPIWPEAYHGPVDLKANYASDYAGRTARQNNLTLIRANILSSDRSELAQVLKLLTRFAIEEMEQKPSIRHVPVLEPIPESYRVTMTLGFGSTLFVDKNGTDRFGLRARKPKWLKPMPGFPGDATDFDPAASATDFIFAVSSDHPYVNVATTRFFVEFFNEKYRKEYGSVATALEFVSIEQGFARKDKREFLKFDDGIDNIHMGKDDLIRLVYVDETDTEPDWCVNGTYMVYRKIRENMPRWEAMALVEQEGNIGRNKETGKPLSRQCSGADGLTPVYPDPTDARDGPLNAHIRKVQPRRSKADLFGIPDLERRFLRRPYPFFDGVEKGSGHTVNGLQFVAFMKSIQQQFEHVVNMWQMNPDFPVPDAGIDALFANQILSTLDGGYYFCPPGLQHKGDYFGSGLFEGMG
ncbi:MAG: hypothetical protein RL367_2211 [Pseudomonadota bacterium]|jgi:deferrochelatase/peroxidase EfeB